MPLLYYESGLAQQNRQPQGGPRKYVGEVAQGYDKKRESSEKWQVEQQIVEKMLDGLADGDWVLDAPIGTGRFISYYERRKLQVRGIDISADMLAEASAKVTNKMQFRFAQTPVWDTKLEDKSVDAAVMVRLTRWLTPEECQAALIELQRVARKMIIFTARVANHPHARPLELFEEALDGWKVVKNEAGYEEDYRVIQLVPV